MTREQLNLLIRYINAKVAYAAPQTPVQMKHKLISQIVDALGKLEETCE